MTLEEFNSKYVYKSDKNYDDWSECKLGSNGTYYGDCESYVISLKKKVDGFKDLEYYFCYLNGVGHCIGVLGENWVDCNTKRLLPMSSIPSKYSEVKRVSWLNYVLRRYKAFLMSLIYRDN